MFLKEFNNFGLFLVIAVFIFHTKIKSKIHHHQQHIITYYFNRIEGNSEPQNLTTFSLSYLELIYDYTLGENSSFSYHFHQILLRCIFHAVQIILLSCSFKVDFIGLSIKETIHISQASTSAY